MEPFSQTHYYKTSNLVNDVLIITREHASHFIGVQRPSQGDVVEENYKITKMHDTDNAIGDDIALMDSM